MMRSTSETEIEPTEKPHDQPSSLADTSMPTFRVVVNDSPKENYDEEPGSTHVCDVNKQCSLHDVFGLLDSEVGLSEQTQVPSPYRYYPTSIGESMFQVELPGSEKNAFVPLIHQIAGNFHSIVNRFQISSEVVENIILDLPNKEELLNEELHGLTPLMVAALSGCEEMVNVLLSVGKSTFMSLFGCTFLNAVALGFSSVTAIKIISKLPRDLVDAAVNFGDANGFTPLHVAASLRKSSLCAYLVKIGALQYKDRNNRTPLYISSFLGDETTMEILSHQGADLDDKDALGVPMLLRAVISKKSSNAELLLIKGADAFAYIPADYSVEKYRGKNLFQIKNSESKVFVIANIMKDYD